MNGPGYSKPAPEKPKNQKTRRIELLEEAQQAAIGLVNSTNDLERVTGPSDISRGMSRAANLLNKMVDEFWPKRNGQ